MFPTTLRSWGSLGRRGTAGRAGRTGAQTGQRARSPSCLEAAPAPSPQEPSRCGKGGFIAVEMLALSSSPNLNFFLKSEAFPPPCPACTCATALPTTLRLAAIRGHLFQRPLWRATPAVTSARWPGTFRPPPSPSRSRFPQPEGGRPGSRGLRAPAAAVPVGGRQAPEAPQPASRPSRGAAWARWAPSVGKGLSRARLCSRPACGLRVIPGPWGLGPCSLLWSGFVHRGRCGTSCSTGAEHWKAHVPLTGREGRPPGRS